MNNNTHECTYLPKGIFLESSNDKESEFSWLLYIEREASESDLEDSHYLENEGDPIWTTMLEVIFCPYCGEKLPGTEKINKKSYGKFSHIDSSGWSSKVS